MAVGTPEQVALNPDSWTGKYLRETLKRHEERRARRRTAALKKAPAAPPAAEPKPKKAPAKAVADKAPAAGARKKKAATG